MISLDHRFALVHINKNGGTSLEEVLRPFETTPQVAGDHAPSYLIADRLGPESFGNLESFAIVRNPFDRFVSSYEYRRQFLSPETAPDDAIPPEMSFEAFILEWVPARPRNREVGPQMWFVTDLSGNEIIVKHIRRFEDGLEPVFREIVELCRFPENLQLPARRINATERKPWKEYYRGRPELVRVVAERCAADAHFGYDLNPF